MIIAIAVLLLFVSALIASGNGWSNVLSNRRNDLVFDGRNKAYGAYVIRQEHHRVMLIAFGSALTLVAAALFIPRMLQAESTLIPDLPAPEEGVIITILPPDRALTIVPPSPPARHDPTTPGGPIIAVDSTLIEKPDTATTDPGPTPPGPLGPLGPVGPVGPIGPAGGSPPDTLIYDGWQGTDPEYPGGHEALYDDLRRIIRYPQIDLDAGREGKVHLAFVVSEDGLITDVRVGRGVSPTMDAEAIRAVRLLNKRWKPGNVQGKKVRVRHSLPIVFKLARQ